MSDPRADAWQALKGLPEATLAELFERDRDRVTKLCGRIRAGEGSVRFDWSKTHLDDDHPAAFAALAEAADFAKRAALFAGGVVNPTEGRAAEHTAQRGLGSEASVEEAQALHSRGCMRWSRRSTTGALGEVRHLIHIGIGGSALGPALAIDALARDRSWSTSMSFQTSTGAR